MTMYPGPRGNETGWPDYGIPNQHGSTWPELQPRSGDRIKPGAAAPVVVRIPDQPRRGDRSVVHECPSRVAVRHWSSTDASSGRARAFDFGRPAGARGSTPSFPGAVAPGFIRMPLRGCGPIDGVVAAASSSCRAGHAEFVGSFTCWRRRIAFRRLRRSRGTSQHEDASRQRK
jgi:hypothetical protein